MIEYDDLPQEAKDELRKALVAFPDASLWKQGDKYFTTEGVSIVKKYDDEYGLEHIGKYHDYEVFSDKERIENYINTFRDYPSEYKGLRNYSLMREMDNSITLIRANGRTAIQQLIGKLDEYGNFVLTGEIKTVELWLSLLQDGHKAKHLGRNSRRSVKNRRFLTHLVHKIIVDQDQDQIFR